MDYRAACELQVETRDGIISARRAGVSDPTMTLFLVEHDPPVITVSRRPTARRHLIANEDRLAALGIEVCETDRGGDITYHGPGQLVAYPIVDLKRLRLGVHDYMRWLESIIIATLARFGVQGVRDGCATGVWIDDVGPARKIAALGVRVAKWVSTHGLAINVSTDLSHFDTIVPCGLKDRAVTSLAYELEGERTPSMAQVKRMFTNEFCEAFNARLTSD